MKLPRSASQAKSLAENLREWYRGANTRGGRAVVPLQIVNATLCQEVLERLAPTLERHKGCVLIDINPGVGLWSRYLHDFLKPRRHILVEPQRSLFAEHLDPLLNVPGSRYTWTKGPLENVFNYDMGDFGPVLPEKEQHVTENPQILLNACFSKRNIYVNSKITAPEPSDYLNDVYNSLYGLRSDLFRHGLFRSLIWLPDSHKHSVLPRTVDRQSRQSLQFAVSSTITEVAGSQLREELDLLGTRNYPLIVEDLRAMYQKERDSGIIVPTERQHELPTRPWEYLHPSIETWRREDYIDPPVFLPDLQAIDAEVRRSRPKVYKEFEYHWEDPLRPKTPQHVALTKRDPALKGWFTLYARARRQHAVLVDKLRHVDERRTVDQAWRAAEASNNTDALADLAIRERESRELINSLPRYTRLFIKKAIDDYRAYDTAAMLWYRRPYDPLAVTGLDFASGWESEQSRTLALLDVNISPQFRKTFNSYVATRSLELVLTRMTNYWSANVPTALATIVPGAIDEFIETVPSLKDSTRGGWPHLDDLRVRALSPELWKDIALAYIDWPFRPDEHRLWHELTLRNAMKRPFSMR